MRIDWPDLVNARDLGGTPAGDGGGVTAAEIAVIRDRLTGPGIR
ncbi:hypothetical protein AB0G04_12580 [Actinoplanes sp. NPDC023801]